MSAKKREGKELSLMCRTKKGNQGVTTETLKMTSWGSLPMMLGLLPVKAKELTNSTGHGLSKNFSVRQEGQGYLQPGASILQRSGT